MAVPRHRVEHRDLDSAMLKMQPGDVMWARPWKSGGRLFFVGPFRDLYSDYMAQPPESRTAEEVYFEAGALPSPSLPLRLFFDCDGKGMSPDTMKASVHELVRNAAALLKELFDVPAPAVYELDSSTQEKQSRHLFLDVAFRSLAQMRAFVTLVLERCTVKHGGSICGVDLGKYKSTRSSNLRLPFARKPGGASPMLPVPGSAFDFEKCVVSVLPETNTPVLKSRFEEAQAGRRRERGDEIQKENWPEAALRVLDWASPWEPTREAYTENELFCCLHGRLCAIQGRVHSSNCSFLVVRFARGDMVTGTVKCADPECTAGVEHIQEDLQMVAYPNGVLRVVV